jgi:hypothetical protein
MKNSISKIVLYTGIFLFLLTLPSFTFQKSTKESKPKVIDPPGNHFVVLELFTSQGCSSCPPADVVLEKYALANNLNVIPLAFHVDYWNYIGWKDPFSKVEFSNRQKKYSKISNSKGIYTPQIIINGKYETVGSRESEIRNKVSQELLVETKKNISVSKINVENGKLTIKYHLNFLSTNDVVNFALVKKMEFTFIKRGENSGLRQTNYNIVYDFLSKSTDIENSNTAEFEFRKDWLQNDFKIVAYVQSNKSGEISAAVQKEISSSNTTSSKK